MKSNRDLCAKQLIGDNPTAPRKRPSWKMILFSMQ